MNGLGVGIGDIDGNGPSFGGSFESEGWNISVAGTIEPPIPFRVLKAALTYGDLENLTGTTDISTATIGPATITFSFITKKGRPINITGVLVTPIPEPVTLKGHATWTIHWYIRSFCFLTCAGKFIYKMGDKRGGCHMLEMDYNRYLSL